MVLLANCEFLVTVKHGLHTRENIAENNMTEATSFAYICLELYGMNENSIL